MSSDAFFAFARARHEITLARAAGLPRPWTEDPILAQYRFTNVFREMDRTTVWIERHVRGRLAGMPIEQQILGVVLARTLNRTETLEQIFCQPALDLFERPVECNGDQCEMCQDESSCNYLEPVGWQYIKHLCSVEELEAHMRSACPKPWVTGAYIVKTPDGMDKLRGALWIVEEARKRLADPVVVAAHGATMERLHGWLLSFPYLGGFTAYEIVSDLRHMNVGRYWPDIMSWAHAGPGAVRGLNRVHGRDFDRPMRQATALAEMQALLVEAQAWTGSWAIVPEQWPAWEMREVEHTLCEFDKYERVRLGQGRPRGVYR